LFADLGAWRRAPRENRELREKVRKLNEELAYERARAAEAAERLRMLAEFEPHRRGLFAREAEVIGQGTGPQSHVLFIDRGSSDGLSLGMAVAVGHSVVGRIEAVAPSVSSVRLVTSPASRFDGVLVATGERGIVVGNGDGTMRMKYVSGRAPEVGTAVVARGRDGLTPKHFVLGRVTEAARRPGALTCVVRLRPVRDLANVPGVQAVRPAVSLEDFPVGPAHDDG